MSNKLLEAALEYAEAGYPVFPLAKGEKRPITKNGIKDATTDIEKIKHWWKVTPHANIGVPMGEVSGLVGLDIDYKDGCDVNFLKKLPPTTIIVSTPTGGHHAYYKYNNKLKNGLIIEKGVTIRSDGYYFVVPPSIHPNGMPYIWGIVTMDMLMKPVIV